MFTGQDMLLGDYKIIDLTHALSPGVPAWDMSCGFNINTELDYSDGVKVQSIQSPLGIGTHIDAPSHFFQNGVDVASIEIKNLILSACVIDVKPKICAEYFISTQDINDFETEYGKIEENTLIIANTGWSQYWNDPKRYRNENDDGNMVFPGFSVDAISLLLERNISGVAIDTLSPDGSNLEFPVHRMLLSQNKYIIENIMNLNKLPGKGAHIIALPMKISDGTEAPARVVAFLENSVKEIRD